jgi:hypothetical protein
MNTVLQKISILFLFALTGLQLSAQQIITSSTSTIKVQSNVSSIVAMSASTPNSFSFTFINNSGGTSLSGPASFQVTFPTYFNIVFPSNNSAFMISPPSNPAINNTYIIAINSFTALNSSLNGTLTLSYTVNSCLSSPILTNFGSGNVSAETISFSAGTGSINILTVSNQTVNVYEGALISIFNTVPADNLSAFEYLGQSFSRNFTLIANGSGGLSNNTKPTFTGIITFSNQLGSSLTLTKTLTNSYSYTINIVPPTGSSANTISFQLNSTNNSVTYNSTTNVSTLTIDCSSNSPNLPGGIPFESTIQIVENVTLTGCLDVAPANGHSTATVSWQDVATNFICQYTVGTIPSSVSNPLSPFQTSINIPVSPSQAPPAPYSNVICQSLSTTDNSGQYSVSKVFTNNITPLNSTAPITLSKVAFELGYDFGNVDGFLTRIPVTGISLTRIRTVNSVQSTQTLVPLGSITASSIDQFYSVATAPNGITVTNSFSNFYNGSQWTSPGNVIDNQNQNCSSSSLNVIRLYIDQYPVINQQTGATTYVALDYQPGDVYTLSWQEFQCCRTYGIGTENIGYLNNDNSHAVAAMLIPTCVNGTIGMTPINNDLSPYNGSINEFGVVGLNELATTTVLYTGPKAQGNRFPIQTGNVDMEISINGFQGMNSYQTIDVQGNHLLLDFDVLLTDGLSINSSQNIASPSYNASITFNYNGQLYTWNGQVIPNPLTDPINQSLTSTDFPLLVAGIKSLDGSTTYNTISVNEYSTIQFDFVVLKNLLPTATPSDLLSLLNILNGADLHFELLAVDCPGPLSINPLINVRSYLVNNPSCANGCRNYLTEATVQVQVHCPGCQTPGMNVNVATTLRNIASLGPLDNDNNGVPDVDQSSTASDKRIKSSARLGDLMDISVMAAMSDGSASGYTLAALEANSGGYQTDAYLQTKFDWTQGGIELQNVTATYTSSSSNQSSTVTVLDINNTVSAANTTNSHILGSGYIEMLSGGVLTDYNGATPASGTAFLTSTYNTFYFHVNVSDFLNLPTASQSGIQIGDNITFNITYKIVEEIYTNNSNNLITLAHFVYTTGAPKNTTNLIWKDYTNPTIDATNQKSGSGTSTTWPIGMILENVNPTTNLGTVTPYVFFWCTSGESTFGYVQYKARFNHYLEDSYNPNKGNIISDPLNPLNTSCEKIMHVQSYVYANNPITSQYTADYAAFANEYRTLSTPSSIQVEIPSGYTITQVMLKNSNIPYYSQSSPEVIITEYYNYGANKMSLPVTVPNGSNNNVYTFSLPAWINEYQTSNSPTQDANNPLFVTNFQQMDDVLSLELIITLNANCGSNANIQDNVCWYDQSTDIVIPMSSPLNLTPPLTITNTSTKSIAPYYSGSTILISPPVITIGSLPVGQINYDLFNNTYFYVNQSYFVNSGNQTISTNGRGLNEDAGQFYFILPKTEILAEPGNAQINVSGTSFQTNLILDNIAPSNYPNPYSSNSQTLGNLPSIPADHAYLSIIQSQIPPGYTINSVSTIQIPTPNTTILPVSGMSNGIIIFDLGPLSASSSSAISRNSFWINGTYSCNQTGCDPFNGGNCLNSSLTVNYGWNCLAMSNMTSGVTSCTEGNSIIYNLDALPVAFDVTVQNPSQTISPCSTQTYSVVLTSKDAGAISDYAVTVTLPSNASYVPNSSMLYPGSVSGSQVIKGTPIALNEPAKSLQSSSILTFDLIGQQTNPPLSLNSGIQNNSIYILEFGYTLGCTNATSAVINTAVVATSYCGNTSPSNPPTTETTLNYTSPYDNLSMAMSCTSGSISQNNGIFSSTIAVTNASNVATVGTNTLTMDLPYGLTLNVSGTTSGYVLNGNTVSWVINNLGSAVSQTYTVNYKVSNAYVSNLTCNPTPFLIQASISGTPNPEFNCAGCSNVQQQIVSPIICTSNISGSGMTPTLSTNNGQASFLCDATGSSTTPVTLLATANGTAPFTFVWSSPAVTTPTTDIIPNQNTPSTQNFDTYTTSTIGAYTVTVTDANNCTGSITKNVVDVINVNCPGSVCPGTNPPVNVLTTGIAGTYAAQWYYDPNNTPDNLSDDILANEGITFAGNYYAVAITPACTLRTNNNMCYVNLLAAPKPYVLNIFSTDKTVNYGPALGICSGFSAAISVMNPTDNAAMNPTIQWGGISGNTPKTDLSDYVTNVPGNYSIIATDAQTGCSTASTVVKLFNPDVWLTASCGTNNDISLIAYSNFAAQPTDYTWTVNQTTPFATGQASITLTPSQFGNLYTVLLPASLCGAQASYFVPTTLPNSSSVSNLVTNGDFENLTTYCTSGSPSTASLFSSQLGCLSLAQVNGNLSNLSYTIGNFFVDNTSIQPNPNPLQQGAYLYNSGWSGTAYSGNSFMLVDGNSSAQNQILWSEQVSVTPGMQYFLRASLLNLDVANQYPVRALPQLTLQVTYLDKNGNGSNAIVESQTLTITPSGPNQWVVSSGQTLANAFVSYADGNGEAVSAVLSIIMNNSGAVGNDVGIDDIEFWPIGLCTSAEQVVTAAAARINGPWGQVVSSQLSSNITPCELVDIPSKMMEICSTSTTANFYITGYNSTITNQWYTLDAFGNTQLMSPQPVISGNTATITLPATGADFDFIYQVSSSICSKQIQVHVKRTAVSLSIVPIVLPVGCKSSYQANLIGSVIYSGISYVWSVNGAIVTTTTTNQVSLTVKNGDVLSCQVSNVFCGPVTSTITVSGIPNNVSAGVNSTICAGNAIQIGETAVKGRHYSWTPVIGLNSAVISSPMASPTATTTYSVAATDTNGCTSTSQVVITVNAAPATSVITGTASVCANQTAVSYSVVKTTGSTYAWTLPTGSTIVSGAGTNAVSVTFGTGSGNISVQETNTNGCLGLAQIYTVTVNPFPAAPVITVTPSTTVCSGAYIGIAVNYGTSNTLINSSTPTLTNEVGGGGPGSFGQNGNISASGNVVVTISTALGCGLTITQPITVLPNPTTTAITGSSTVCAGQTAVVYSVTKTTGSTYAWTLPSGASITAGSGTNSITVNYGTTSTSGTVSVVETNVNGCLGVAKTFAVAVNPLPTAPVITVTPSITVCSGTYISIGVNYGTTNTLIYSSLPTLANETGGGGPGSFGQSGNISASGNVVITMSTALGCSLTTTQPITVLPNPSVTASTVLSYICPGGTGTTINATPTGGAPGYTYSWTPTVGLSSATVASPTANPTATTTYTITVTDTKGCQAIGTTIVNFQPSVFTASTQSTTLCGTASINIPYTALCMGNTAGNVFTAQLSNASGSFTNPINIGTLSSTTSGTITASIPSSVPYGTGYRIRVISSAPSNTSTDNGTNLTIIPLVYISSLPATSYCTGQSITISYASSAVQCGNQFTGSNIFTAQLSDASSSFANPVTIGTLSGTAASGNIIATIPAGTIPGPNYRIRIISSSVSNIGPDNGVNIAISNNCGALSFNGTSGGTRMTVLNNTAYNFGTGNFTIQAWVKLSSSQPTSLTAVLSNRTSATVGFRFSTGTGTSLLMQIAGVNYSSSTTPNIHDNNCHHVAVTRSGGTLMFYVDGVAYGTAAAAGSMNGGTIYVGYDPIDNYSTSGIIDDVSLWNTTLSGSTIFAGKSIIPAGNTTGLVAYWDFNETGGQVTYDGSSTENNGYLGSTTSVDAQDATRVAGLECFFPALESGLVFDGIDDRATIPNSYNLAAGNFTVEAWVQLSSTNSGLVTILSDRTSATSGLLFTVYNGTSLLLQPQGVPNLVSSTFTSIYDNACHHVAVTRSGSTITFYLDGVSEGTATTTHSLTSGSTIYLGYDSQGNGPLKGSINEVRIWNIAQPAAQIVANLKVVLPSNSSGLIGYWKLDESGDQTIYDGSPSNTNGYLGTNQYQFDAQDPLRTNTACFSGDRITTIPDVAYSAADTSNFVDNTVRIYPNPFSSETNIIVSGSDNKPSIIKIYDLRGELVYESTINFNKVYKIGSELDSSLYLVVIIQEGESPKIVKIIKQE